jgi:hypothetical protein
MVLSFLERAEAVLDWAEAILSKLSHLSDVLKPTPMLSPPGEVVVASVDGSAVELFGCFFPRVGGCPSSLSASTSVLSTATSDVWDAMVAPVLQIMPELRELRVSPDFPLLVEHMKVHLPLTMSSPKRSGVPTTLFSADLELA